MAINSNDILAEIAKYPPEWDAFPVEVSWPDQNGTSGETRRVIAVVVENSGDPEVPTLRLICGTGYTDEDDNPEPLRYQDFSQIDQRTMPGDPINHY